MKYNDFDDHPPRGGKRKGRKNATKQVGARNVVKRAAWLSQQLVYWSGTDPRIQYNKKAAYRPITQIIADRLMDLPQGLYALHIEYSKTLLSLDTPRKKITPLINPLIVSLIPITNELVAKTAQALAASRRYPRALEKVVEHADAWRLHTKERLTRASKTLEAVSLLDKDAPESLALEEICIWIGPDELRPSRRIDTKSIQQWLESASEESIIGMRVGAVVLGQRHVNSALPKELGKWAECGSVLSSWPPDLVFSLSEPTKVSLMARTLSVPNSKEAALTTLEYTFSNHKGDVASLLNSLSPLTEAYNKVCEEPRLRHVALQRLFYQSYDSSLDSLKDIARRCGETKFYGMALLLSLGPWNYIFGETLSQHFGQLLKSKGLTKKWWKFGLVEVCESLMGYGLPRGVYEEIYSIECDSLEKLKDEVQASISGGFKDHLLTPSADWKTTIFGLTGRVASFGNSAQTANHIASWLDQCRQMCAPRKKGDGALILSTICLERGLASSDWSAPNVIRLTETLGTHGDDLLRKIASTARNRGNIFSVYNHTVFTKHILFSIIGRLGELQTEQYEQVIRIDLFDELHGILSIYPNRLTMFMNLLLKHGDHANVAIIEELTRLSCARNEKLIERISEWISSIESRYDFSKDKIAECLEKILDFCIGYWPTSGCIIQIPYEKQRQEFLACNMWLPEKVLRSVQQYRDELPIGISSDWTYLNNAFRERSAILEIVFYFDKQGYGDLESLVDTLLERCASHEKVEIAQRQEVPTPYFKGTSEHRRLAVMLSAGKRENLMHLLTMEPPKREFPETPLKGWLILDKYWRIQEFIGQCTDSVELLQRIMWLLRRLALAARLKSLEYLENEFNRWMRSSPINIHSQLPMTLSAQHSTELKKLLFYRKIAGCSKLLPLSIRKVIDRPASLQKELKTLEDQERYGTLRESAIVRLDKLRKLLASQKEISNWVEHDLASLIDKQLRLAKLEALESIIRNAIRQHWIPIIGNIKIGDDDDDRDNALLLYYSVEKNKRLLLDLLRHEAKGDREWALDLPSNRRFSREIQTNGIDMDVWLGSHEKHFVVNGEKWAVYAEMNPLKVLQMGNLFGTCLSVGNMNDFSTVANAVEVNKRVLYIKDEKGRILGRKLIVLNRGGILYGFYSYGSGQSYGIGASGYNPWIKIAFDNLCLDIIKKSGIKLFSEKDNTGIERKSLEQELTLFSKWYNDGIEPFDWWAIELARNTSKTEAEKRAFLIHSVVRCVVYDRECSKETLRAIIWLEKNGISIVQKIIKALPFEEINHLKKSSIEIALLLKEKFPVLLVPVLINNKWGYKNLDGKTVIKPQFDNASNFSEGLSLVSIGCDGGYIDINGKMVIKHYDPSEQSLLLYSFSEEMAGVRVKGYDGGYGYIDKTGKVIIMPQFEDVDNFSEGLASVKIHGKWGYIDKTGKVVIEPKFDRAACFINGLSEVKTKEEWFYIDKTGKVVWKPNFNAEQ